MTGELPPPRDRSKARLWLKWASTPHRYNPATHFQACLLRRVIGLRLAKEKTRRPYLGNPGGPIMTSPGVCGVAGENAVRPAGVVGAKTDRCRASRLLHVNRFRLCRHRPAALCPAPCDSAGPRAVARV